MKQIQKGFTLIELMIVVAIIGILAAVAIPAYQDYIVKAKLSKVQSTLDPVKLALAMYYQEQGSFPNGSADLTTGLGVGGVWTSLGFNNYPSVPQEVQKLVVDGSKAGGVDVMIQLTLQNIKVAPAGGTTGFDGKVLAIVGTPGSTAIDWKCSVASGTTIQDTIGLKYFDPKNQSCLP